MNLAERIEEALNSECREHFLAILAHELTVAARDAYVEVGRTPESSSKLLRCHNELQHSISGQLRAYLADTSCYPDDVFARNLVDKAQLFGGCQGQLEWAVGRVMARVGDPDISSVS